MQESLHNEFSWRKFLSPSALLPRDKAKLKGLLGRFLAFERIGLTILLCCYALVSGGFALDNVFRLDSQLVLVVSGVNTLIFALAGYKIYQGTDSLTLRYLVAVATGLNYATACYVNAETPFVFASLAVVFCYLFLPIRQAFVFCTCLLLGCGLALYLHPEALQLSIVSRQVVELIFVVPFVHFLLCFSRWTITIYSEKINSRISFMNTVSHEIRAPLAGIVGITTILRDLNIKTEPKDVRERVHTQISRLEELEEHLTTLVNNALQLTQIHEGNFLSSNDRIPIKKFVESAVNVFKTECEQKGIDLCCYISDKCGQMNVEADPIKVRQLVFNLLSNAIKFTENGSIKVTATLVSNVDQQHFLNISVLDTGIGIQKEKQYQIYEAFTQLHNQDTLLTKGAGLGLHLVKELTQELGGKCGFTSTLDRGSLFWFSVPVERPTPVVEAAEASVPNSYYHLVSTPVGSLQGCTVLVVDDDTTIRKIYSKILEKEGAQVINASNGKDAIEVIKSQERPFDVILLDIQMPVMDGIEAAKIIRQMENYERSPILCVSGAIATDETNVLDAGFTEILSKPVKPDLLKSKVAYYSLTTKLGIH